MMELKHIANIPTTGTEACHVKKMFMERGMSFEHTAIQPHVRIPAEGASAHDKDEFCYFVSGEIVAWCDGKERITKPGEVSFIPKGQPHWSRNDSNEECIIITVMLD